MSAPEVSVTLTRVGVSMGDRAENVVRAVAVDPTMTVGELAQALLTRPASVAWGADPTERVPALDDYITLRVAAPADQVQP